MEYLPRAGHCSTFDRAFSLLSHSQLVGKLGRVSLLGECDLRQQVLDTSLSCFGHPGVSGGTSASQRGDLADDLGDFEASL